MKRSERNERLMFNPLRAGVPHQIAFYFRSSVRNNSASPCALSADERRRRCRRYRNDPSRWRCLSDNAQTQKHNFPPPSPSAHFLYRFSFLRSVLCFIIISRRVSHLLSRHFISSCAFPFAVVILLAARAAPAPAVGFLRRAVVGGRLSC